MNYFFSLTKGAFLLFFLFTSCAERPLDEEELKAYVVNPSNGLYKEKSLGSFRLSVSYKPTDILAVHELSGLTVRSSAVVDSVRELYADSYFFLLSISNHNQSLEALAAHNSSAYEALLSYLGEGIANEILLISGKDTLSPAGHLYVNLYNTTGESSLQFMFKKEQVPEKEEDLHFIFSGNKLGIGLQKFKFRNEDIQRIPEVIF